MFTNCHATPTPPPSLPKQKQYGVRGCRTFFHMQSRLFTLLVIKLWYTTEYIASLLQNIQFRAWTLPLITDLFNSEPMRKSRNLQNFQQRTQFMPQRAYTNRDAYHSYEWRKSNRPTKIFPSGLVLLFQFLVKNVSLNYITILFFVEICKISIIVFGILCLKIYNIKKIS